MISPTKCNTIRSDSGGDGKYGSRRGNKIHKGVDYLWSPQHPDSIDYYKVVAPISGKVIKKVDPYGDGVFSGLLIQGSSCALKVMYFTPLPALIGDTVLQGDLIGYGQDISTRPGYEKCEPHIHMEVDSMDLNIFINEI